MSTVAGIHLGRADITPLESVLASLEQYVLFVQGKSCLSPLTLLCLHFPPPLTGFLNEMLSGTPLKLGTSVLCIQQVTTTFPQLLEQTHFSERYFIPCLLLTSWNWILGDTSANTDCIHQLILMAPITHVCMWGQVTVEGSNGSQWGDKLHHQQGVCIWVNAGWPSQQCSQNFTCLFWELH